MYLPTDITQIWLSCSTCPLFFLLVHSSETIISTSSPTFLSLGTHQLLNCLISSPCAAWTHIHETKKTTQEQTGKLQKSLFLDDSRIWSTRGALLLWWPNSAFASPCAYGTDFQDQLQAGAGSPPGQEMWMTEDPRVPQACVEGNCASDSSWLLLAALFMFPNRKTHTNTFCLELSLLSLLAQKCLCRIWD